MEAIGYVASVCIGVVLGILGGGGSILSIPILVYLFNVDAVMASAYSLFIVGVTSLVGAVPKYREQLVNIRTGLIFGIPSILAIFSTRRWIVPSIPDILFHIGDFAFTKRILLLGIFAVLMILASIAMIKKRGVFESDENGYHIIGIIIQGLLIGFLTGLVGAGGGFLIIPALVLLTGIPFKTAVGTSLFIIAVNSLIGFLGDVLNYEIQWNFLFEIT
ncbi:MAG TPA: sulfite exporter TauE/SafE family protein, partial [Cyclobacteriaceae bacterium]|nr:sulfite exporter TauE/SafE family protein [Cyclobacteriaceae bacterium]